MYVSYNTQKALHEDRVRDLLIIAAPPWSDGEPPPLTRLSRLRHFLLALLLRKGASFSDGRFPTRLRAS